MYLQATVVYEDKFGTGKTVSMVSENAVEERTTANAAPSFKGLDETGPDVDDDDQETGDQNRIIVTRDVDEGVKGANVGKPIGATDADNDVLLYSIDKPSQTNFSIDSRSGQLKTKNDKLNSDDSGTTGDADGEMTEPVMVTATDPTGASSTVLVTITVNDVNDAPKFAKYAPTATDPQNDNPTVLTVVENTLVLDRDPGVAVETPTYAATDADFHDAGDGQDADASAAPPVVALTYEVTGADKSAFTITLVGDNWTLAFKSDHKVNYEAKDEYSITIVASDDDAPEGVGTVDVTVNVTNAEDDGVVTRRSVSRRLARKWWSGSTTKTGTSAARSGSGTGTLKPVRVKALLRT